MSDMNSIEAFFLAVLVCLVCQNRVNGFHRKGFFSDEPEVLEDDQHQKHAIPVIPVPSMGMEARMEAGSKNYEILKAQSKSYGVCWLNAIESLHTGCRELDDETQARLGLAFANCFLEKIGQKTYPCPPESSIMQCASNMDDRAYQAYTQFFTHTQSVCFFLANQVWQQRAENTIHELSTTSIKVTERLEDMNKVQAESIQTQRHLNQELSGSRATLESFEKTLQQKHSIEHEMLNRFLEMRQFILMEVSKFYSLAFYIISLIIFYLTTTPVRTMEARFWIFALFGVNFVLERLAVSDVLSKEETSFSAIWMLTDDIDSRVWFCRKVTLAACIIVLGYFAVTYRDYAILNNYLLNDIHKQNEELKKLHFLSLSRLSEKIDSDIKQDRKKRSFSFAECIYSDDSGEGESDMDSPAEISDTEVILLNKESHAKISEEVTSTSSDELKTPVIAVSKSGVSSDSFSTRYNLRTRRSVTPMSLPPSESENKKTRLPNNNNRSQSRKSLAVFSSEDEI